MGLAIGCVSLSDDRRSQARNLPFGLGAAPPFDGAAIGDVEGIRLRHYTITTAQWRKLMQ